MNAAAYSQAFALQFAGCVQACAPAIMSNTIVTRPSEETPAVTLSLPRWSIKPKDPQVFSVRGRSGASVGNALEPSPKAIRLRCSFQEPWNRHVPYD